MSFESLPKLLVPSAVAGLAMAHALLAEKRERSGMEIVYTFIVSLLLCLLSSTTITRVFSLPLRRRQLRKLKSDMCCHVDGLNDEVRESSVIEEDWPSSSSSSTAEPMWKPLTEVRTREVHQCILDCCEADAHTVGSQRLKESSAYAFKASGKMARSRVVLLMADVAAEVPPSLSRRKDSRITAAKQSLLAEVIECEHNASLLHDDVVDEAATRRGLESHCCLYGNQQAVWTGDFIISVMIGCLSKINEPRVTARIASSMQNLVKGELLQVQHKKHLPCVDDDGDARVDMASLKRDEDESTTTTKCGSDSELDERSSPRRTTKVTPSLPRSPSTSVTSNRFSAIALKSAAVRPHFKRYILKSFYKTASLFASAMECVAILADLPPALVSACYLFGVHFGLEFQIRDDMLDVEMDVEGSSGSLGKPKGTDLLNGQATAPFLFACDDDPSLLPLVERGFKGKGDAEMALEALQRNGKALQRAKLLVGYHASKAIGCLLQLPDCDARQALIDLTSSYAARTS